MTPPPPITGLILAGGMGSRMGGLDKGLLEWQGRPLVEHLLLALRPQVTTVLINANRNLERYQAYGLPVVSDALAGFQGPLAGLVAGMEAATTPYILTIPCDAPRIASDMAERLWQALQAAPAELAVAHDGERLQPVHALIPVRLLPSLRAFLAQGDRKLVLWYTQHRMATADFSDKASLFRNINTPAEQQALEQEATYNP